MSDEIEVRMLKRGEEHVLSCVDPDVFDDAIDPAAAKAFLEDSRHHIAVAVDHGVVVGFASGVHYVHPDKPHPELFINELGVATTHRRQGLGKRVLNALFDAARALGCSEAWVLTERDNAPAMGIYASIGGVEGAQGPVMFTVTLNDVQR